MGLFHNLFSHDDARNANEEVYNADPSEIQEQHKGKFSHELIAGAAGFEAVKAYEDHLRKEGKPVHHAMMKELLASFATAEVDKLIETKGLDWVDAEKAKKQAVAQAHAIAEEKYGSGNTGYEQATGGN